MTTRLLVCLIVCAVSVTAPALGQPTLTRSVFGSGASDMSSGTHRITGTAGQAVAGPVRGQRHITGQGFWYQVQSIPTAADDLPLLPRTIVLHQNYPNPFNPTTLISFQLSARAHVRLQLYRPSGRLLAILVDETLSAGMHRVRFEAGGLPAGMYTCRLISGDTHAVRKMLLIK